MRCIHCGSINKPNAIYCKYCNAEIPMFPSNPNNHTTIINYNPQMIPVGADIYRYASRPQISPKSYKLTCWLTCLGGVLGLHQFYIGNWGKGFLYMFTGGLAGIGWAVDVYKIARKKLRDTNGLIITNAFDKRTTENTLYRESETTIYRESENTRYREVQKPQRKYAPIYKTKPLELYSDFVVIDTETTGLSGDDVIVEIAMVKYRNYKLVDTFSTIIDPQRHISSRVSKIHGITDQMVMDKPVFSQVIGDIINFVGDYSIVGHNLPFDLRMIEQSGYRTPFSSSRLYDTLKIAKKHASAPNNKLTTLCDFYGIRYENAHRALDDCISTAQLFICLIQEITGKKIKDI